MVGSNAVIGWRTSSDNSTILEHNLNGRSKSDVNVVSDPIMTSKHLIVVVSTQYMNLWLSLTDTCYDRCIGDRGEWRDNHCVQTSCGPWFETNWFIVAIFALCGRFTRSEKTSPIRRDYQCESKNRAAIREQPNCIKSYITTHTQKDKCSHASTVQASLSLVHGIFMWIAISVIMPIGIIVAHFGSRETSRWFAIHASLQTFATLLVITAFVLVEVTKYSDNSKHASRPHEVQNMWNIQKPPVFHHYHHRPSLVPVAFIQILGLIVVACVVLQLLSGLFRASYESEHRKAWFLQHRILGAIIISMAFLNVFAGARLYGTNLVIILHITFSGILAIAALVLLCAKNRKPREERSSSAS